MNATQEQWRPVVGFEGLYEVSNCGRVRSLDRLVKSSLGRKRKSAGRILKPWTSNRGGYLVLKLAKDSEKRKALVQVLVLEAFVGPRPDGMVCCHNDGDATNNHLSNLRWDTYSANNHDLVKHGTHWNASKTHCPRGHEYTSENTRHYVHRGWNLRYCRACEKISSRAAKSKLKALRAANPKKPGARRRDKCNRGHWFTEENTYTRPDGLGRSCIKCQEIRQANYIRGERSSGSEART